MTGVDIARESGRRTVEQYGKAMENLADGRDNHQREHEDTNHTKGEAMTKQQQLRHLTEIEALFADPNRWCRGHFHSGSYWEGPRYCVVGAWIKVAYGQEPDGNTLEGLRMRHRAAEEVRGILGVQSAMTFNDIYGYDALMTRIRLARGWLQDEIREPMVARHG